MRVAIVVPWYFANGGAEKLDGVLGELYPDADIYAIFARESGIPEKLKGRKIHRSFLDKLPAINKIYRPFMALFPYAIESFDLRGYDLIITSDWACVKGIISDPAAKHICYCHTPMRHIWDLYWMYLMQAPWWMKPGYAWSAKHLREWDFQAAQRVDYFIANSEYIAKRIQKYYRRHSSVIYPPVDISRGFISREPKNYYLTVGRLNRTKRLDLLVQACTRLGRRLIISGWGPEELALKALSGPTIQFLGRAPDGQLPKLYANCRALLFAADEDFGIVPVEAQSFGRPVIAFGYGGSLETVRVNDPRGGSDTGVFYPEQTVESVIAGIEAFEAREDMFIPQDIQAHAAKFDAQVFTSRMRAFVEEVMRPGSNNLTPAATCLDEKHSFKNQLLQPTMMNHEGPGLP